MQEIIIGSNKYQVKKGKEVGTVEINGETIAPDIVSLGNGHYHMILNGSSVKVEVVSSGKTYQVKVNGRLYEPEIKSETDLLLERLGLNTKTKKTVKELKAPMPGLVLDIRVEVGQKVKEGDPLIVLEAMKMENILKAPAEATVKAIAVQKGAAIDKNTLLISFE